MSRKFVLMKSTILNNVTLLGGQVLLLQPKNLVSSAALIKRNRDDSDAYPQIYFSGSGSSSDAKVQIKDHIKNPDNRGILHLSVLGKEYLISGGYHHKIYEAARNEDFDALNTFVYEYPDMKNFEALFPKDRFEFMEKIDAGTLDMAMYENLFKVPAYEKIIMDYFMKMQNKQNFLKIWNWFNQKTPNSEFQKKYLAYMKNHKGDL